MSNNKITIIVKCSDMGLMSDEPVVKVVSELQEKLKEVPEDYRDSARFHLDMEDGDINYIWYDREPTPEEIERADSIFRDDRAQLIRRTEEKGLMRKWITLVCFKFSLGGVAAREFIETDDQATEIHPLIENKVQILSDEPF